MYPEKSSSVHRALRFAQDDGFGFVILYVSADLCGEAVLTTKP
jgi:hypothetical protein